MRKTSGKNTTVASAKTTRKGTAKEQPVSDQAQAKKQSALHKTPAEEQPVLDKTRAKKQPVVDKTQAKKQPVLDKTQAKKQSDLDITQAKKQPDLDKTKAKEPPLLDKAPSPLPAKSAEPKSSSNKAQRSAPLKKKKSPSPGGRKDDLLVSRTRSSRQGQSRSRLVASTASPASRLGRKSVNKTGNASVLPPSANKNTGLVVTASVEPNSKAQSAVVKDSGRAVNKSKVGKEVNGDVSHSSAGSRKRTGSRSSVSSSAAVVSSAVNRRKRVIVNNDDDLEALGPSAGKRGKAKLGQEVNGDASHSSMGSRKRTDSGSSGSSSAAVSSSAANTRRKRVIADNDGDSEALGPSAGKRGKATRSQEARTTSSQKLPKRKEQPSAGSSSQSTRRTERKMRQASNTTQNGSVMDRSDAAAGSSSYVRAPPPKSRNMTQILQKTCESPKRFFTDTERSPEKLVANKIVGVKSSQRKGFRQASSSFWKTSRRISSELKPQKQQFSVSSVYDDDNVSTDRSYTYFFAPSQPQRSYPGRVPTVFKGL